MFGLFMDIMIEDQKNNAQKIFGGNVIITSDSVKVKSFDRVEHETKDRSWIAKVMIYSFLAGIAVILIGTPIYNALVTTDLRVDIFNILTTYSGILGPFVGVIAGHYFKN